ncbi:hypothetical protein AMAG_04100 [Allomyces macrogynus ATCC 38327]|uniref:CLASP N-terminal domain-containing protein n=1 Tax=Allomyces macrogynus (strain ATCC 38327) TaxID=578462 RepID=A0A0L0S7H9_ALLM3|nr:hypothetical protein AMAG_04100 [Allomyces macrogynus ATCC 38327]|eukprot:KNE58533.1 hypothetical protein AMAG_04100 [Allomyces macrogynus ATCC 38327]
MEFETRDAQRHLDAIAADIAVKETEQTWEKMDAAIRKLKDLVPSCSSAQMAPFVRQNKARIEACLKTDRTRLSGSACELVLALAQSGSQQTASACELFVPALLALTSRTNRIFIQRSQAALQAVVAAGNPDHFVMRVCNEAKNKAKTTRLAVVEAVKVLITSHDADRIEQFCDALEGCLKATVDDSAVDVRQAARSAIEMYRVKLPNRSDRLLSSLSAKALKSLGLDHVAAPPREARPTFKRPKAATAGASRARDLPIIMATSSRPGSAQDRSSSSLGSSSSSQMRADDDHDDQADPPMTPAAAYLKTVSTLASTARSTARIATAASVPPTSFRPLGSASAATPAPTPRGTAQESVNVPNLIMEARGANVMIRARAFERLAALLPTSSDLNRLQRSLVEAHMEHGLTATHPKPMLAALQNVARMMEMRVIPQSFFPDLIVKTAGILQNPQNKVKSNVTDACCTILQCVEAVQPAATVLPMLVEVIGHKDAGSKVRPVILGMLSRMLDADTAEAMAAGTDPQALHVLSLNALMVTLSPALVDSACTEELRSVLTKLYVLDRSVLRAGRTAADRMRVQGLLSDVIQAERLAEAESARVREAAAAAAAVAAAAEEAAAAEAEAEAEARANAREPMPSTGSPSRTRTRMSSTDMVMVSRSVNPSPNEDADAPSAASTDPAAADGDQAQDIMDTEPPLSPLSTIYSPEPDSPLAERSTPAPAGKLFRSPRGRPGQHPMTPFGRVMAAVTAVATVQYVHKATPFAVPARRAVPGTAPMAFGASAIPVSFPESPSLVSTPLGIFGTQMPATDAPATTMRKRLLESVTNSPLRKKQRTSTGSPTPARTVESEAVALSAAEAAPETLTVLEAVAQQLEVADTEVATGRRVAAIQKDIELYGGVAQVVDRAIRDTGYDAQLLDASPMADLLLFVEHADLTQWAHALLDHVGRYLPDAQTAVWTTPSPSEAMDVDVDVNAAASTGAPESSTATTASAATTNPAILHNTLILAQQIFHHTNADQVSTTVADAWLARTMTLPLPAMVPDLAFPAMTLVAELQLALAVRDTPAAAVRLGTLFATHPVTVLQLLQRLIVLDVQVFHDLAWFDAIVDAIAGSNAVLRVRAVGVNFVARSARPGGVCKRSPIPKLYPISHSPLFSTTMTPWPPP